MTAPQSTPSSPQSHSPPAPSSFSAYFPGRNLSSGSFFSMCVIVIKRAFPGGAGNIIIPTFRFRRRDKESADRVVATVGLLQDQPQSIQHSTSSAAAACKRLPFVIEIPPHLRDYWKTAMDFRIHRSVHFKERVITCRRHHPGALVDSR